MINNNPTKHHYIPECYLKTFGNNQKQLWKRSKENSKTSSCSPAQVGYEINANKIRNEEILNFYQLNDNNHIEKDSFKKQENNYSKTLSKIVQYSPSPLTINKEKYRLFLETLITIKRRNPVTREFLIKAFSEGYKLGDAIPRYKAFLLEQSAIDGISLSDNIDEKIEHYIKNRATNPDWLYDMYLTAYIKSSDYDTIDKITNQLYSLKQFILHSPLNTQFITSDNPGFTRKGNVIINAGGFGDTFEFYFPLSPYTCLYLNSTMSENQINIEKTIYPSFISESQISQINQFTKFISNKKLFGNSRIILEKI